MRASLKILSTAIVVLAAAAAIAFKYRDYITDPWTRDGQVRAQVIQVAPRVSGPIVKLAVKDNQFVKAADLLFEIDPPTSRPRRSWRVRRRTWGRRERRTRSCAAPRPSWRRRG